MSETTKLTEGSIFSIFAQEIRKGDMESLKIDPAKNSRKYFSVKARLWVYIGVNEAAKRLISEPVTIKVNFPDFELPSFSSNLTSMIEVKVTIDASDVMKEPKNLTYNSPLIIDPNDRTIKMSFKWLKDRPTFVKLVEGTASFKIEINRSKITS